MASDLPPYRIVVKYSDWGGWSAGIHSKARATLRSWRNEADKTLLSHLKALRAWKARGKG